MKFGIVCDVESKIIIGTGVTVPAGEQQYIFYADHETLFLNQVRIISEAEDSDVYSLKREGNCTSWSYEESLKKIDSRHAAT